MGISQENFQPLDSASLVCVPLCYARIAFPLLTHLEAATWEDPSGSQIWLFQVPAAAGLGPGDRGAGRWTKAAVRRWKPWGWKLLAEAVGSAQVIVMLPRASSGCGVSSHRGELAAGGLG